jgi:hypothetical protein
MVAKESMQQLDPMQGKYFNKPELPVNQPISFLSVREGYLYELLVPICLSCMDIPVDTTNTWHTYEI